MTDELFSRKFSISKIKDNNQRKSVIVYDQKYEFNASKFFDFSIAHMPNEKYNLIETKS